MLIDVDYFFEWSVANRLNKIQWLLLENFKWGDESLIRHARLKTLTSLGHHYSLMIGAVVPIGNIQQHGWYMVNVRLPLQQQYQQMKTRIDWIFTANFDFLTTESGLSEFTHPECDLMLDLLNYFAMYTNITWGREAAVKVHCSTGQHCGQHNTGGGGHNKPVDITASNLPYKEELKNAEVDVSQLGEQQQQDGQQHQQQLPSVDSQTVASSSSATSNLDDSSFVASTKGSNHRNYLDPRTGDPLNFNFLPMYADVSLGVFPHTVQMYSLQDPTGGAYGNANFQYMEDYLVYEAKHGLYSDDSASSCNSGPSELANGKTAGRSASKQGGRGGRRRSGRRSVQYYGETSYWVNVDIDVPLFLPLYGQRRLHDLYHLAQREQREGFRIDGQMNFDSGWEYGYWLADVVTARSSWKILPTADSRQQPSSATGSSTTAKEQEEEMSWQLFSQAIEIFTHQLYGQGNDGKGDGDDGSASLFGQEFNQLLVNFTRLQARLLIFGQLSNHSSYSGQNPNLKKLSGIAYLSGTDTWSDLPRLLGLHMTQPNKIHLKETTDEHWPYMMSLLDEMEMAFGEMDEQMERLWKKVMSYIEQSKRQQEQQQQEQEEKDGSILADDDDQQAAAAADAEIRYDLTGQATVLSTVAATSNLAEDLPALVAASSSAPSSNSQAINRPRRHKNSSSRDGEDRYSSFEINPAAISYLADIKDCITLLYLRAKQVHRLYASKQAQAQLHEVLSSGESITRYRLLAEARDSLAQAHMIISRREQAYRVSWQRIAAWRENPTVYRFMYLWAVHSLYYWWRDQGIAEETPYLTPHSACYLNRMDSTEVAVGWGKYTLQFLRNFINRFTIFGRWYPLEIVNCLSPPATEYQFPKDLHQAKATVR